MSTVIDGLDYGPLAGLVGKWEGDRGMDIAPDPDEADGIERNPFSEVITFEAIGDVTNGGEQVLTVLRYHQVVTRKSTGLVFHDQVGHWTYDASNGVISHSLSIPRAVCVLAGGTASTEGTKTTLQVEATLGGESWGIVQSPFMVDKAKTLAFTMTVNVEGDKMSYRESTLLDIYGKEFDHRDKSDLVRVA